MMLERLIYQAINEGIEVLKGDPDLLVEFFCTEALLPKEEAEKIRDYFLEHPPHVIHGYARADAKFPLYAITLTSQGQSQGFIGDEGSFHDDPEDPDFGQDDWAAVFDYNFNVIVYANHPDITLYYFHLLINMLILAEPLFKVRGDTFDISYSGADMVPDSTTMPAGLFLRRCQVAMKRQYTQTVVGSKLGRTWTLSGLHVDDGSTSERLGGVTARVTAFMGDGNGEED